MPKNRNSPRQRPARRTLIISQSPLPDRGLKGSNLDAEIRKDGARRPLKWED